jgi:hypothetical protein
VEDKAKRRIGWSVASAVLTVIGLGGIRGDLAGWWTALGFLDTTAAQWAFVGMGAVVFGAFVIVPSVRDVWEDRRADEQAEAIEVASPLEPLPHDPEKTYTGTPSHKVSGQGRFRALEATLDVGSGYDTGVTCEIVRPDGQSFPFGWEGVNHPKTRREIRDNGFGIWAREEGPYTIRWWSRPPPGYAPELIAEEEVPLGPTGPLDGWIARHSWRGKEIVFEVAQESSGNEHLHGFKCEIFGPSPLVPFVADHRSQEETFGLPSLKATGSFVFPQDFSDAPAVQDLHDGDYTVYWTAWDVSGEPGLPNTQLDVARDTFHITWDGSVE